MMVIIMIMIIMICCVCRWVFRRIPADTPQDTRRPHQLPRRYLANTMQPVSVK